MNPKRLVKLSNIIGVVSIILLIYWIFIFCCVEVFGLKVFRQNITETFYISVLGILALMFGALMVNIMFNLTRIADRQNADRSYKDKNIKTLLIVFVVSFPLIFALLVGGDYYTTYAKERAMTKAAEAIIVDNKEKANRLADYSYDLSWVKNARKELEQLSKLDRYFPTVSILVKDTVDNYKVYLEFNRHIYIQGDSVLSDKQSFIKATTQVERDYLAEVFDQKSDKARFSKHRGNYELFYPYIYNGKIIVFYFSDYQEYGKVTYDSYTTGYTEEYSTAILEPMETDSLQAD